MYQNSLEWFVNMLLKTLGPSGAEQPPDEVTKPDERIEQRIDLIIDYFTYSIYKNLCRSMFVKDKILFSMVLCTRILEGLSPDEPNKLDSAELRFLLTGGVSLTPTEIPNPSESHGGWLSVRSWNEIVNLSTQMPKFDGFHTTFANDVVEWRRVYDSNEPQSEPYPGEFESYSTWHKLLILRCLRPDKVVPHIVQFITEMMDRRYVDPPPFNLADCYADSNQAVPLIFILSPGADPMAEL